MRKKNNIFWFQKIKTYLRVLQKKFETLSATEKKAWQNILFSVEGQRTFNLEGSEATLEQMKYAEENIVSESIEEYKAINIKQIFQKIWNQKLNDQKQPLTVKNVLEIWRGLKLFSNDKTKNNTRDKMQSKYNWAYIWNENKPIYFLDPAKITNELNWWVKFFNNLTLPEMKSNTQSEICWILHHYFEQIHPFPDGNGRVGRLLISLFLSKYNLWIKNWICPISFLLYQKRSDYIAGLNFSKNEILQKNGKTSENFWQVATYDDQKNYFSNLKYDAIARNQYLETMDKFFLEIIRKTKTAISKYQIQKIKVKEKIDLFVTLSKTNKIIFFKKTPDKKIIFLSLIFSQLVCSEKEITKKLACNSQTTQKIMRTLRKNFREAKYKGQTFYINVKLEEHFGLRISKW